MSKPRIIKSFEKLDDGLLASIKLEYPYGFEKKLIMIKNAQGKLFSVLPFETDDYYFLIKMSKNEAKQIVIDDIDFDEQGNLKENAKIRLEDEINEDYNNDID